MRPGYRLPAPRQPPCNNDALLFAVICLPVAAAAITFLNSKRRFCAGLLGWLGFFLVPSIALAGMPVAVCFAGLLQMGCSLLGRGRDHWAPYSQKSEPQTFCHQGRLASKKRRQKALRERRIQRKLARRSRPTRLRLLADQRSALHPIVQAVLTSGQLRPFWVTELPETLHLPAMFSYTACSLSCWFAALLRKVVFRKALPMACALFHCLTWFQKSTACR